MCVELRGACDTVVTITFPGYDESPRIAQLPFTGDQETTTVSVSLSRSSSQEKEGGISGWEVVVRVPVLGVREWLERLRADAPHRFGSLSLSTNDLLDDL